MFLIHGSSKPHKIGVTLQAKKRPTEWSIRKFAGVNIETFLEKAKPRKEISRLKSIFMVKKIECLNLAGASEDYVYLVETRGHITKAHFGWITHIIGLLFDEEDPPPNKPRLSKLALRQKMIEAADNYWAGTPCNKRCKMDSGPSAWEYLAEEALIIRRIY